MSEEQNSPDSDRSHTPDSDDVALLDTGVNNRVVRCGQDIGKVDGFFVRDLIRDLQAVDITDRDFDPSVIASHQLAVSGSEQAMSVYALGLSTGVSTYSSKGKYLKPKWKMGENSGRTYP
jgi:hypothetical protein